MNRDERPNPDLLLSAVRQEERGGVRRGRLKIFLGMCAGVGKTFAMLRDAQARKREGCDVVVAYVETHGRQETEALLSGLPILPRRRIQYRDIQLEELDIDAVLLRKPTLALVDELAHTTAPGSRHPKRYQDVLELLDAGIDVYTTLNVQHIESRVDVVGQIVRVPIRETIPDSILDQADDVHLVDLTPEELRERLSDGKVYLGARAATAADNFFRPENLTALREIALRVMAEHVGHDVREAMAIHRVEGPWKSGERLLVAVGPSPYSEPLIRWTRRIASAMDAPWLAVYIETSQPLTEEEKDRLSRNLLLARQLGGETLTDLSEDVAAGLLRLAREHNATQIVVGKPMEHLWMRLFGGGTLVTNLIRQSGDIDICVVRAEKMREQRIWLPKMDPFAGAWKREIPLGLGIVAAITVVFWFIQGLTGYWSIALLYLLAVVMMATRFSRRAIVLTATVSALAWNYLFIPPLYTLWIDRFHDALMFGMYFIVALVVGQLTSRLRMREVSERRREQRTQALYRLVQSVVESTSLDEGLRRAIQEMDTLFQAQTAVVLTDEAGGLDQHTQMTSTWTPNEKEMGVAAWSFLNNRPAGRFTETLPEAEGMFLPLRTAKGRVGVLAIRLPGRNNLGVDERELLETITDNIAAIIERYRLIQQSNRAHLAEESERLYKTLFDCVSHELKTPLAVMTSAAGELNLLLTSSPLKGGKSFLDEIETAVRRLRRIVDNLLDMTRLESGRLRLETVWCDVEELIDAAREQVGDLLSNHRLTLTVAPKLPSLKLDFALMQHSLANLLSNAAQYSPPGSEIRVSAHRDENQLIIRISDFGPGFSGDLLSHAFDKFYRGPNAKPGGTGLGLSIVKGFVQAMGGHVEAANNPDGGATFTLRIPVLNEIKTDK